MSDEYDISITRACKLMGILEITNEGFWKIFRLIRKDDNIRCDNGPEFISHEFQSWCKGIFGNLDEVRELTEKWMDYYNNERPHNSLNNLAPMKYRLARTG